MCLLVTIQQINTESNDDLLYFPGGLIQVSGSASFIRESSVLQTDETFTMAFKSTAYSEIIPTALPLTYPKICDQKATHVVSKIVYGKNAYFFFKHAKKSGSEKQDVAGTLQAVVESIPRFSIKGSASVKLSEDEKNLLESTKVRFNGDFQLKNGLPTTYEGAVDAFKELSSKYNNK